MTAAVRLALGTLSVLPVRAPASVDRRTAGRAMVLAPLVGWLLAALVLLVVWLLGGARLFTDGDAAVPALLGACFVVGGLAVLTRGLHLDGLADTADGLGSGRSGSGALEVMRRSDIGPFGVVTLLMVLLVQVAATRELLGSPFGLFALVAAVVLSRAVLPLLCSAGLAAARPDGLGATVAGSVSRRALVGSLVLTALAVAATWVVADTLDPFGPAASLARLGRSTLFPAAWLHVAALVVVPLAVAGAFAAHCVRRFGGVSGDVLGACVEVALTVALVVAVL